MGNLLLLPKRLRHKAYDKAKLTMRGSCVDVKYDLARGYG